MSRRSRHHLYSIKHLTKRFALILIPILILDFAVSYFALYTLRDQEKKSLIRSVEVYSEIMNSDLVAIRRIMGYTNLYNHDLEQIQNAECPTDCLIECRNLYTLFSEYQRNYGDIFNFFVYIKGMDFFINSAPMEYTYSEYQALKSFIVRCSNEKTLLDQFFSSWIFTACGNRDYIINLVPYNDRYLVCVISAENLITPLQEMVGSGDGIVAFKTDGDSFLVYPQTGNSTNLLSRDEFEKKYKRHILTQISFNDTNFSITVGTNSFGTLENIVTVQFLIVFLSISLVLTVSILMLYTERKVLKPIKSFTKSLEDLNSGSEMIDWHGNQITELEQTSKHFSSLVKQIKSLKIEIYEKQLEQQRSRFEYMQLQIRPHFFLNCLNSIYSMAKMQMFEEIEKMTISTSKYFRYIFQNCKEFVPLENEADHIRDYLSIQKILYGTGLSYSVKQDNSTYGLKILPLLLQTFVENSVRYTVSLQEEAFIWVNIELADLYRDDRQGKYIKISILDTGPGFSEELLNKYKLTGIIESSEGGHCIGIANTISRLNLLYGDRTSVQIENAPQGGGKVTIYIPAEPYTEDEEDI